MLILFSLIIIQTCVSVSMNVEFSDSQMFHDISTFNFAKGRQETYEYTLTARDGNTVSLYLFQNNEKQYTIAVYDGDSDQGTHLSVKIPTNTDLMETPEPTTSTGSKMFIRVTADQSDLTAKVDFQALATDYAQPDECGKMVISVNKPDINSASFKFLNNPGRTCYYITHANDPTNNPKLAQYVVSNPSDMNNFFIFKGLQRDSNHKLFKYDISTWVADKYVFIWPTETVILGLAWTFVENLDLNINVLSSTPGAFMTNDYYQDAYPNLPDALTQTFKLNLIPPVTSIQVSYIRLMGSSQVTVNSYKDSQIIKTTLLLPEMMFVTMNETYQCDVLELIYTTSNRNLPDGSGFYAFFRDASDYTQSTKASVTSTPVVAIQTTILTSKPPPKTTLVQTTVDLATNTESSSPTTSSATVATISVQTSTPVSPSTGTVLRSTSTRKSSPASQSSAVTTNPIQTTTKVSTSCSFVFVMMMTFVCNLIIY